MKRRYGQTKPEIILLCHCQSKVHQQKSVKLSAALFSFWEVWGISAPAADGSLLLGISHFQPMNGWETKTR
jgi:hypothetical protein